MNGGAISNQAQYALCRELGDGREIMGSVVNLGVQLTATTEQSLTKRVSNQADG